MNTSKLKAAMALNQDTGSTLSEALGLSHSRFSMKLNSRNGAEFTQGEIHAIKARYKLSAEQVDDIFFAQ